MSKTLDIAATALGATMPDATVPYATTLHVRDHCLCLHLQRAARRVARRFDEALRPVGLTNGQFSLLMSLNRPMPARLGPVAEVLAVDRTTLTAALKPLERDGLLTVTVDPEDRRGRVLALTPAGRDRLAAALPIWRTTHAEVEGWLGAGDTGQPGPDRLRADLAALS
ncbi:MarR family winged helix-turn-helix transcriptional regulator [Nitrospirillum amazonense]|uniref:MarR family transcriptional regulator n=1 Tax=Nitrospirillum amazonense TaxID=28077 RepID=A0A560JHS6_9PROT|nr:MarR family transcriptional regulator [Nitrospirillum amazonense]MDG3439705.1 MarR family transcriptional regulator [Nitrospirillum amazonense]TWB70748.1 MarR family transcriptional regulator [Nitrospirillum amazonense]